MALFYFGVAVFIFFVVLAIFSFFNPDEDADLLNKGGSFLFVILAIAVGGITFSGKDALDKKRAEKEAKMAEIQLLTHLLDESSDEEQKAEIIQQIMAALATNN